MTFRGTQALVTGGAGFVGSNLVRRLLAEGASVRVVDNLLSSERDNLPDDPRLRFDEASAGDLTWLAGLDDSFEWIFHLATYHGNQSSIADPLADHQHNLLPTLRLLERTRSFTRLRRFVYAGAGCAVAEKTPGPPHPTPEDAPVSLRMDSPYSISKLAGEMYVLYFHARHGVPGVRARFQNVYGPGEVLGAGRWRGTPATVWRNVVPTFIYRSIKSEPLPLEGGGRAGRDFIFVDDVVEGLLRCAMRGEPGDVYNLASGIETSIADLAAAIDTLTGSRAVPRILPGRDWDRSGRRLGDPTKARARLGFEAKISLESGLARTVSWTRANLSRIERCIARHAAHLHATEPAQV